MPKSELVQDKKFKVEDSKSDDPIFNVSELPQEEKLSFTKKIGNSFNKVFRKRKFAKKDEKDASPTATTGRDIIKEN